MRTTSMGKLVDAGIGGTKKILFQPFNLRKWLWLLLIAVLAGALGAGGRGGSGGSGRSANQETRKQKQESAQTVGTAPATTPAPAPAAVNTNAAVQPAEQPSQVSAAGPAPGTEAPKQQAPAEPFWKTRGFRVFLVFAAPVGLALYIFFVWLNARFRFIWYDALVHDRTLIREPLENFRSQGQSLFRVNLGLALVWLAVFGATAALMFPALRDLFRESGSFNWSMLWKLLGPVFIFFLPLSFIGGIFAALIGFTSLLMYRDRSTFLAAWKRLWALFRSNVWDFILFWLMKFVLGIAAGILGAIVTVLGALAFLLACAAIAGPILLATSALVKVKAVTAVFAVLFAVPAVLAAIIGIMLIQLPFAVFFQLFQIAYLSSHGAEYAIQEGRDVGGGVV